MLIQSVLRYLYTNHTILGFQNDIERIMKFNRTILISTYRWYHNRNIGTIHQIIWPCNNCSYRYQGLDKIVDIFHTTLNVFLANGWAPIMTKKPIYGFKILHILLMIFFLWQTRLMKWHRQWIVYMSISDSDFNFRSSFNCGVYKNQQAGDSVVYPWAVPHQW